MLKQIYLSPKGRCSRRFYWLFYFVPSLVLGVLLGLTVRSLGDRAPEIIIALLLLLAWPSVVMHIKRWHDIGRSGWFSLLGLIPVLGFIVVLVLGLIPGTKGPNKYGPSPLREYREPSNAL